MSMKVVLKAPVPDGLQSVRHVHNGDERREVLPQYARTMQTFICDGDAEVFRNMLKAVEPDAWFELRPTGQKSSIFIRTDNIAWVEASLNEY